MTSKFNNALAKLVKKQPHRKDKLAVIGSGNWGSVAAKLVAENVLKYPEQYEEDVKIWVFEETLPSGEKLSEVINRTKENVKYLPGVNLGRNVVPDTDLISTVKDATMLVFVTPHQFLENLCKKLQGNIRKDATAISLIKGMEVKKEGPRLISTVITEHLGIDCAVLMGANIANEIAQGQFSEATVGYKGDKVVAEKWAQVFEKTYFLVSPIKDAEGVELCGTLKNIVGIAAGFVDGLDMGSNTKAAVMRIGLKEIFNFSKLLYPGVKESTLLESCGVADLITTCIGGRNRKVAEAFAKAGGTKSFHELEAEMLKGEKIQGVLTAAEVYTVLQARKCEDKFPLFATTHKIATGQLPPHAIIECNSLHYGEPQEKRPSYTI